MPVTSFHEYARAIQEVLGAAVATGEATTVTLEIDERSSLRGFLGGLLRFSNGHELHFREFVDLTREEPRLTYAYHYQSAGRFLIFRYDNASHRPPCVSRTTSTLRRVPRSPSRPR